jgi:hypothetical protein
LSAAAARLRALLAERILVIEGQGTNQAQPLEADFRGSRIHPRDLRSDNSCRS